MGEKFRHPEVFMGVKGQEFPAYDPRGFQGMGVAYATCNRGACHLRAWTPGVESSGEMDPHTPVGKSEWVVHEQNRTTAHDNTGICMFVGGSGGPLESLVPCTAAVRGVSAIRRRLRDRSASAPGTSSACSTSRRGSPRPTTRCRNDC